MEIKMSTVILWCQKDICNETRQRIRIINKSKFEKDRTMEKERMDRIITKYLLKIEYIRNNHPSNRNSEM